jgi:acylphosphatase
MADLVHWRIHVTGRVQGVAFRACTRDMALKLGVAGTVRNNPDGSVEIEAEAPGDIMLDFYNWCKKGPPWARVMEVSTMECPVQQLDNFRIVY